MQLIDGYQNRNHVTSNQVAKFNYSLHATDDVILTSGNNCKATIVNNTSISIADGIGMIQGRRFAIEEPETVTFSAGTAGYYRTDIVCVEYIRDTGTGAETVGLKVIKGTNASADGVLPAVVTGDILNGATKHQMPLYSVHFNGTTLRAVNSLFKYQTRVDVQDDNVDGFWTYRKTANGRVECWGTVTWPYAAGTAWAGGYYHKCTTPIAWPSGLFTSEPKIVGGANVGAILGYVCGYNSVSDTSFEPYWYNAQSTAGSATYTFLAKGFWR